MPTISVDCHFRIIILKHRIALCVKHMRNRQQLMIRLPQRLLSKQASGDAQRESFSIFQTLSGKKERSEVEKLADEIMTLSLKELNQLSEALNDPAITKNLVNSFPEQATIPQPVNRSPFPHPKHVFAGVDALNRPGMNS